MVPSRMAKKVPVSTSALPATSSSAASSCGRMLYFTGPTKADCAPIRKRVPSSTLRFPCMKAVAATAMITISAPLTTRSTGVFS